VRLYLDPSALVKLVQRETESDALQQFLRSHQADQLATSALARVEVIRAVYVGGVRAVDKARRQLSRIDQIMLDTALLDRAATLMPMQQLRSLDAIHLASAQFVGTQLRAILTYNRRMADAAESLGLAVEVPA
jgi:predicted nucleic acid-binding protein